jgi:hypothetical protein
VAALAAGTGGAITVGASFSAGAAAVGATALSDAPHSSQNASPGSTAAPHDGQVGPAAVGCAARAAWADWPAGAASIREPHCSQKRLAVSFSAPHVGHFMVAPSYQKF